MSPTATARLADRTAERLGRRAAAAIGRRTVALGHLSLRRSAALLTLALLLAGCARAMQVGSEPGPVYRLAVQNQFAEPMIVSYADSRGQGLLGTVPAGRTEHFTIANPATLSISVTARNAAGSRSAGPFAVQLVAGEAQTVLLR
ncbi:hypothetical protein BH23GEM9_BH23GEM9_05860 [soil metagenome]